MPPPRSAALPTHAMEEAAPTKPSVESPSMDEDGEEGDEKAVIEDEPLVAGGLAATLKLLAQKGGVATETFVGRANDKKIVESGEREINLDRRDAMGRVMTIKQAFREQSYKFHGKKPGKNKQEKRNRHYEEERRRQTASSSDTPLNTLQAMQEAQAKTGSAYIVLSSSSIARSTQPASPTVKDTATAVAFGIKRKGGEAPLPVEKRKKTIM